MQESLFCSLLPCDQCFIGKKCFSGSFSGVLKVFFFLSLSFGIENIINLVHWLYETMNILVTLLVSLTKYLKKKKKQRRGKD